MSELIAEDEADAVTRRPAARDDRPGVRRLVAAAAVTVASAVALSGCLSFDKKKDESDSGGIGSEQGAVGGVATTGPNKTIASATFDSPAARGTAKVEIGVVELRVTGQLAQLTLLITPRVPGNGSPNVYELTGSLDPNVSLIDNVNLKRYVVVKDSVGTLLQPDWIGTHLRNEQPNPQTYMFAAPPETVRTVDVVFGQWTPFRNVPVSR
jgi:hypothetical protein